MLKRIVLPMLVVALVLAFVVVLIGSPIRVFIDPPSFILVPLAPLAYMALSAGWKGLASAFRSACSAGATKRDLARSVRFFKNLSLAMWAFGALGTMTGFVVVLSLQSNRETMGQSLAMALLTMLYAALFNLFLALPFQALANRRLAEME